MVWQKVVNNFDRQQLIHSVLFGTANSSKFLEKTRSTPPVQFQFSLYYKHWEQPPLSRLDAASANKVQLNSTKYIPIQYTEIDVTYKTPEQANDEDDFHSDEVTRPDWGMPQRPVVE